MWRSRKAGRKSRPNPLHHAFFSRSCARRLVRVTTQMTLAWSDLPEPRRLSRHSQLEKRKPMRISPSWRCNRSRRAANDLNCGRSDCFWAGIERGHLSNWTHWSLHENRREIDGRTQRNVDPPNALHSLAMVKWLGVEPGKRLEQGESATQCLGRTLIVDRATDAFSCAIRISCKVT